ncbi:Fork-head domain-containing protein [Mycena indigotica]|uniref:Fork-head domain-containing protein n=1 Tax=Mycena indigotica TaxID=2126181 RepID=A0A8H6S5M3_9AGAR|nr:Fork-head domain-containing protein [Mycena indigotica]KAF7292778.1 Fork-head domain-containing protein [Mycena indigotica]
MDEDTSPTVEASRPAETEMAEAEVAERPGSSHSAASSHSGGGDALSDSSPTSRRKLTGPFYLQNILNSDEERARQQQAEVSSPSPSTPSTFSPASPRQPIAGPSRSDDPPPTRIGENFIYSHPPPPPPNYQYIAPSPHPPAGVYIHPHPNAPPLSLYPRSRVEADEDYLRRQLCLAPSVNVDLWAIADPPDGQKPFASLPTLIKLAIHGDPKKKLTLQGICESLVNRFAWFHEHQMDDAWKNSVRHNLSLNKVFRKVPRDAKQMGKGCYWELDLSGGEGHKRPRKRRKHDKTTGTMVSAIQSTRASTTVQIPYGVTRNVTSGPGAVPAQMLHHGPISSPGRRMANSNLGRLVVPRLRPVKKEPEDVEMDVESEDDDEDQLEEEEDELDPEPEEMQVDRPSLAQEEDDDEMEQDDGSESDVESEEATDAPYRPRVRAPPPPPPTIGGRVMRPRSHRFAAASPSPSRRGAKSTPSPSSARAKDKGKGRMISAPGLEALSAEAMRRIEDASHSATASPSNAPPPQESFSYPPPPPPPPASDTPQIVKLEPDDA